MENALLPLFIFIFGTIVGSFLNVVILRWNTGKTLGGRSGCFSCGKTLPWYELIPVFSYLFLNGRCSQCKSKISIQYPLVEITSGLLFIFFFYSTFGLTGPNSLFVVSCWLFVISLILWSSLLVIFVYDIRHKIIPDFFSGLFFVCAFVLSTLDSYFAQSWTPLLHDLFAALVLGAFFFLLWFLSKGRWMGFGDVKLAFGIGLYLGLSRGLSAIAFAFWIGAFVALARLLMSRIMPLLGIKRLNLSRQTLTMKSEVPFAPFLIVGTFLALALGSDIFHITLLLNV